MANNGAIESELKHGEREPVGTRTSRIEEGTRQAVRPPIARQRPRVSLFSGSVLVLVSLLLPFAYDSCGAVKTGSEFLNGDGAWLGLDFLGSDWAARGFYAFALGFAVLTVALVLFSSWRPVSLQGTRLIRVGFAIAGTLSLLVISNLAWSLVFSSMFEETHARAFYAVSILYGMAPTVLWFYCVLSGKQSQAGRWKAMRSRIFLFYLPAAAIDIYLLLLVSLGGLWGFVTFIIGIQMLAIGYLDMARRTADQCAEGFPTPELVAVNSALDTVPVA